MTESPHSSVAAELAAVSALSAQITQQMAQLAGETPGEPAPAPRVHGPRVSVPRSSSMANDAVPSTQRHLEELVDRYTARTPSSKALAQRYRSVLADSRAAVGFRGSTKEMLYPLAGRRAHGSRLEDIDGNRYVDITMGFGVLLFGHEPEVVTEAVRVHLAGGLRLGPRGAETGEAAELLSELTGMERVAFANSGTEANSAAIRLARAATGRDKIVVFHGAYHGHADGVLGRSVGAGADRETIPVSLGIPHSAVADLIVLDYGDPESLRVIEELADRIAAVLVEPVQSRNPTLRPVDFVRSLRDLTQRHGIVLLFDEMLTGFRPHPTGAQHLYGVTPDLVTYGKLLGGGYPIGAIAGRADIMDGVDGGFWRYGDDSYPPVDTTFFGGTYLQHPVAMAAARAVLGHLKEQGPGLQERLNARTQHLADTLNRFFEDERFPLRVAHFGSMFRFEHRANMELLYHHLMLRGVYVWEWRNFFLSTAHSDEDIAFLRDAVTGSLRELRQAGFFPVDAAVPSQRAPRPPATPTPAPAPVAAPSPVPVARPAVAPVAAPAPHAPVTPASGSASIETTSPPPVVAGPALTAPRPAAPSTPAAAPRPAPDLSVYFFGDYPEGVAPRASYESIAEVARFADTHGFHALWLPERHFHSFGGIFPNPSVLAAALARETDRVRINAGSVVLPLHDPVRVAEEWSMVDNLSGGRVGIGCASGWNARDFVFFPDRYGRHKEQMYELVAQVRSLWRGDPMRRMGGTGETEVRLFPRPLQSQPPMFTAIVGNPDSYLQAARHDLGVVTNLMSQTPEQLAENIARYRQARADHGLDPEAGRIVVLLHTYLGPDRAEACRAAYDPLSRYMRSSLSLFSQTTSSLGHQVDLSSLDEDDLDAVFRRAYDRYCDQRALIGTPESCLPVLNRLRAAGVDEVAALVDFGVSPEELRAGLPHLDRFQQLVRASDTVSAAPVDASRSVTARAVEPAPAPSDAVTEPERSGPLSPGQQRIWFLERMLPGRAAYNEPVAVRLEGPLDVSALRTALDRLVHRHEALRTVFREVDGEPRQIVQASAQADFSLVDVTGTAEADAVREAMAVESERRFDLVAGPLFLTRLLRLSPTHHILVLSFHHIAVDVVSAGVIARDLSALYRAVGSGGPADLPELRLTYRDVAQRQLAAVESDPVVARDLDYWTTTLGGDLPILDLPVDRPRPAVMTSHGKRFLRTLPPQLTGDLRRLSRDARGTLFMTLLAGYAAMLHSVTGQTDLVVATPVADRPEGTEDLVGFFVNTVALRFDLSGDPRIEDLLTQVRGTALDAYDHATAPFESVIRAIKPPRDTSRTPVFQVMAEYETGEPVALDLPGVRASQAAVGADTALVDLSVYFTAHPDRVDCYLEYNTDLFDEATVASFFERFQEILAAAAADPDLRLSQLPTACAGPHRALPSTPVHALVTEQARRAPDRIAVTGAGTELSYGELDRHADHLASRLRRAGVGASPGGAIVALWLPRAPELIVAMLAVLKAGAAYLPLDPALGPQRVDTILADSGTGLLITSSRAPALPSVPGGVTVLDLDDALPDASQDDVDGADQPATTSLDDPCYVLYTSGTTGRPKGVALPHRGVVNLCQWHRRRFDITERDRSAVVASQSFDSSVLEIWPALTAGASLGIADEQTRLDPVALARWYTREGMTFSALPTALGEALLALPDEQQPTLRHLLIGGDQLRRRPSANAPYTVANIYGPAEITVLVTAATVAPVGTDGAAAADPIPIGHPIDNTRLYILDERRRPVPAGDRGELYIGGPGVASGYLFRDEQTAERFVAAPFDADERLYRTGDLVRRRADGALEFCGRTDEQVKIRGFRVEPGDVIHTLRALPGVRDAVVVAHRDGDGDAYLAGYAVPSGDVVLDADSYLRQLAAELSTRLPGYMVPRAWAVLDALPLGPTGKLNRAALPPAAPLGSLSAAPPTRSPVDPSRAADTSVRTTLRTIWAAQLGLEESHVGDDASFFTLGGDSISAIRLLNRVHDAFGTEYPMVDFYQRPTLRSMAERLVVEGPRVVEERAPVTVQQERVLGMLRTTTVLPVWNVSLRISLTGPLRPAALEAALGALTQRHQALRCRFVQDDDGVWQEVLTPRPTRLPVEDATDLAPERREQRVAVFCAETAATTFDLTVGTDPVARLLRTGRETWVLMLVLHHASCDGWALSLLLRELGALYRAELTGVAPDLPEPSMQCTQYARWQRDQVDTGPERSRKLGYWARQLAGVDGESRLPTDKPRPETPSGHGDTARRSLGGELPGLVAELARGHGSTPFAVTTAALGVLLSRLSGWDDLLIAVTHANRSHLETESLVTSTATVFGLRVRLDRAGTFRELVDQVTLSAMEAVDHLMPLSQVAEALRESHGQQISGYPPYSMTYQNTLDLSLDLERVRARIEDQAVPGTRKECSFGIVPRDDVLQVYAEYATDLWHPTTVEGWLRDYEALLLDACQRPDVPLQVLIGSSSALRARDEATVGEG